MPFTRLKRLALTFALCLGMIGATAMISPSNGVQADTTCNTESCVGCGTKTQFCSWKNCCDSDDLPCDEDDSWKEACYGEGVVGEE